MIRHPDLMKLRKPQRDRVIAAVRHLERWGTLNRADIMLEGEVSIAQASADIAVIRRLWPDLMHYDMPSKTYLLNRQARGDVA